MTYPQQSNFRKGEPYSAWWQYQDGSLLNVCATQGMSVLMRVSASLGIEPARAWTPALFGALAAKATEFEQAQPGVGWSQLAGRISSSVMSGAVSPEMVTFAVYLAYYRSSGRRLDAIKLPRDAALPLLNVPLEDDGNHANGNLVCYVPSMDTPPEIANQSQLATAISQSQTGVRLVPGRQSSASPTTTPPSIPLNAGASGGTLAVIGLVFLATVWLISKKS